MNTLVPEDEIPSHQGPDAQMVANQAIVIPETVDAIRALTAREQDPDASMAATNAALHIGSDLSRLPV